MKLKLLTFVMVTLLSGASPAFGATIFESASPGALSDYSGITVGGASKQIYGSAFEIASAFDVSSIGGLFFNNGSGFPDDIFGALVKLPSITSLPNGNPFDAFEVVAVTVFNVGTSTPNDVTIPLSVRLNPGFYALVFGSGQFGTAGVATLPETSATYASNYLVWNTNGGQWFGGTGYGRVFVNGDVSSVPEPATWAMMIVGFGLIGGAMRRRQSVPLKASQP